MAGGDPLIGQTISHYRIVEKLGGGGMGVVYKAEDARLQRPVALKFLSDDLAGNVEALTRFQREARAASALNHPHICTVYDIGEQDGRSFIAMEYLDGITLHDRLAAGPLGEAAAIDAGIEIADALDAAHGAGIIHRDIKPANILIGSRGHVKVLDFGVAKMRASAPADETTIAGTRHGAVIGTTAYMAPEQARGEAIDHRADLWSFGLVLREMVTGSRLTPAQRQSVVASPELERIIGKCLETDPHLRYQHAADLRTDLDQLKRGSAPPPQRPRARVTAVVAGAIAAAAVVGYIFYPRPAAALTDKDTLVLGDFTNTTGDAVFDETLRQGLAVQLQQSPFLSLISDERIRRTLPLMNQPADAKLTSAIAQAVCIRTGSAAVLEGSIAPLGTQYVVGLRATECASGDLLANEQAQAARKEEVLAALSEIATRFRTRVGESLATIEKHSTPLEEATTTSLEALKAYSAAMATNGQRRIPLLRRALELDPDFAMAHAHLGFRLSTLGESALARQSLLRAYQLRSRASNVERYYIDTLYERDVTGNMERELQTLEAWAQSYPRDSNANNLPAGLALSSTGQHERAIAQTLKSELLEPDSPNVYSSRARNQLFANRPDDALATVRLGTERGVESSEMDLIPYYVAYLRGNQDEIERTAAAARKNPELADFFPHLEALALARAGRLRDARRIAVDPVRIAQQSGRRERAALFEAGTAIWEGLYGNADAARNSAGRALELGKGGREVEYAVAFALALAGDLRQSRALADNLAKDFPEDTSVQFMHLPALRGLFALSDRDPAAAIQALQIASRYDLAPGRLAFVTRYGAMYPVYVRGLAFLAAKQPREAVAEFQRIIDHRHIVLVDPMDAMARLQLARALALAGETAKARSAYDDLLTLWKDADADLAIVKQARAEAAR